MTTTDMKLPVQDGVDDHGQRYHYVEPSDAQLDAIAKKAQEKAEASAKATILSVLGVKTLDLAEVVPKLRTRLRDPEVDNIQGTSPIAPQYKAIHPGKTDLKTHRYTIDVPDEGEHAVLNLGHGDPKRDLNDAGISARTFSHIHLHTQNRASSSMVALGGPTKAKREGLADPKKVLEANHGISAVTNGHLWAEAIGQINLASHSSQAVLRAHSENVRIQADERSVEVGAGSDVVLGAKKNVKIQAHSAVDPGDNAYKTPFSGALATKLGSSIIKDLMTVSDFASSAYSFAMGMKSMEKEYEPGKNKGSQFVNDVAKSVVDAGKLYSTAKRFAHGKEDPGGQVKIAAESYASVFGGYAASVYGHLSASLTSLVSASVVGGTASLKGLSWASVWAGLGVSIRTVAGKASLTSEKGKASISGAAGVSITSKKTVSIGGDATAELKSEKGTVFIAAGNATKICAGPDEGMGLSLAPKEAYLGDVGMCHDIGGQPHRKTFVCVNRTDSAVELKTSGAQLFLERDHMMGKAKERWEFRAKTVALRGSKKSFIG